MSLQPFSQFGPLVTAMVTPFASDGTVDYARAEELASRLIDTGSTGLVLSGTTGESPTLSPAEKVELFRVVKEAVGSIPVIANTGDNETAFSVELTQLAENAGIDGILMVVPYYNRPSQEGLFQHFKKIAESVSLPCLLYNVPGRSARNMDAETTARLAEIPNIVGIKEASADLTQIAAIRTQTPDAFQIYSGNDSDVLPMLTLGCCGVISVVSHIAGPLMYELMEAFWSGDILRSRELHLRLLPVIDAIFPATSPNPAPIKAALELQGFDCGGLRLPLVECTAQERENIRIAMKNAGIL